MAIKISHDYNNIYFELQVIRDSTIVSQTYSYTITPGIFSSIKHFSSRRRTFMHLSDDITININPSKDLNSYFVVKVYDEEYFFGNANSLITDLRKIIKELAQPY